MVRPVRGDSATSWAHWTNRRPVAEVLHLDTAAAGRQSEPVLVAVADHARREAQRGAYVAEAEAQERIESGRRSVATMLGLAADELVFVESATAALSTALRRWQFASGATVGVLPSEWGPNLEAFAAAGLSSTLLETDASGHLDLDAFARTLRASPPAIVHLTHVSSHRGLIQPVAAANALCRAAGVPLWVDAAQALGHVDTAIGPDVVYATSRKWLGGPRGVGVLGVAARAQPYLRLGRSAMLADGLPALRALESHEAHIAGRVGFSVAVAEHLADGAPAVHARLAEVGELTREALSGVPGWVVETRGVAESAITAIRPVNGQSVLHTRDQLVEQHAIVTTACAPVRAPAEMTETLLRISPQVDLTARSLERLCAALTTSPS